MIFTGRWFTDLMKWMFGRDWPSEAGRRLGLNRNTMMRWGKSGPPKGKLPAVLQMLEDHIGLGGTYYDQLRRHMMD
jgi:hypothetical protein